jgi:hypothetical protein
MLSRKGLGWATNLHTYVRYFQCRNLGLPAMDQSHTCSTIISLKNGTRFYGSIISAYRSINLNKNKSIGQEANFNRICQFYFCFSSILLLAFKFFRQFSTKNFGYFPYWSSPDFFSPNFSDSWPVD